MTISAIRLFNQALAACQLALFRSPKVFLAIPVHTACATPRVGVVVRQLPDSSAEPLPQAQGRDR